MYGNSLGLPLMVKSQQETPCKDCSNIVIEYFEHSAGSGGGRLTHFNL
jgi:hypothetical protein